MRYSYQGKLDRFPKIFYFILGQRRQSAKWQLLRLSESSVRRSNGVVCFQRQEQIW